MKFQEQQLDLIGMTKDELTYGRGFNAGIAYCKKVLAERKQKKWERKRGDIEWREFYKVDPVDIQINPITAGLDFAKTTPNPNDMQIHMTVKAWMEMQKEIQELSTHIIDVDDTAGKRFKDLYARVEKLEKNLSELDLLFGKVIGDLSIHQKAIDKQIYDLQHPADMVKGKSKSTYPSP